MLHQAVVAFALSILAGLAIGQSEPVRERPEKLQDREAAQPTRPAITILLDTLRPVTADDLRRRLKNLIGADFADKAPAKADAKAHWLTSHSDGLIGVLAGHGFRVRFAGKPVALAAKAIEHLGPEAIAAMQQHTAHAVVELQGTFSAKSQVDDYEILGAITCGLLRRGVSGISASEFHTFEFVDADMRESLLESPVLDVLRPVAESTLVVFLAKPRELTEQALQNAMAKELPEMFGEKGDGFVVVQPGMTVVGFSEAIMVLTLNAKVPMDPDSFQEMRVKKAIEDHQALLHIWTSGAIDPKAERQRQRNLARIAAALWGDDCLALSWYCDLAMVPRHPDLPAQLRVDDPVAKTIAGGFAPVTVVADEAAMDKAMATARRTWPQALKQFEAGIQVSAKFPFATRDGGLEHIWITVAKVDGKKVHGALANQPVDVEGLQLGSSVTCKLAELSDWLYVENGEMLGGYTIKVMQKQAEANRKK